MGCGPQGDAVHSCISSHYTSDTPNVSPGEQAGFLPARLVSLTPPPPLQLFMLAHTRRSGCLAFAWGPALATVSILTSPQMAVDAELPWSPGAGCPTRNIARSLLAPLLLQHAAAIKIY